MTTNTPACNETAVTEAKTQSSARQSVPVVPPVDIYEDEHGWTVKADMPGVHQGDAEVSIERGVLTLSGKVADEVRGTGREYYREYNLRNYFRQLEFDEPIDEEKITAELNNGVLTVVLPHSEAAKPRRIEVQFR